MEKAVLKTGVGKINVCVPLSSKLNEWTCDKVGWGGAEGMIASSAAAAVGGAAGGRQRHVQGLGV